MEKSLRIENLEIELDERVELSEEELQAVAGGTCGTAGTYDYKEKICCVDSVCF